MSKDILSQLEPELRLDPLYLAEGDYYDLCDVILREMQMRQWKNRDLARAMGISKRAVKRGFHGSEYMTIYWLRMVAMALGLNFTVKLETP